MAAPAPTPVAPGYWRRDLLCLTVAFAILFFFRLGTSPLANPDEGRYAEIAREMVVSGDWVTPRLNGVNYFEKPPLVYWVTAVGLSLFGDGEWVARVAPALFALGGVLLTYAATRRLYGRWPGIAAAVVLGTSLFYYIMGRSLFLDMSVSVLMSATLFCFILAVRTPVSAGWGGGARRWFFYGLYISAALATLTKGMIGFMVTGAVMFCWLLIFNQWRYLRPLYLPSGVALFLAVALPWHILAALRNETWVQRYIVYEHFERFLTPAASREGPPWYFIPIILVGLFPWVGFLWPAVRAWFAGGWKRRAEHADRWFFVTWFGFIFLFFSVSSSKLPPYILPVFPALAVIFGRWIGSRFERADDAPVRGGTWLFAAVAATLAVLVILAVTQPKVADLAEELARGLRPTAFAAAATLLLGAGACVWLGLRRGARAAFGVVAATMLAFYLVLSFGNLPDSIKPGTKALALIVKARAQPGDRVVHYHEFFHDFTFYADRVVDVVAFQGELQLNEDAGAQASGRFMDEATFRRLWDGPQRVFAVARRRDLDRRADGQVTLFTDPTFRYHLLGETRRHYLFSNHP
ncbi:glycosyltransferase family 39 protein [Opitutus sp. ER46]|uniref:glycosyltransferase family 39 protein n=1 Tax=Opitutus sp. ER46 TaxID=2161864 RepID=UPI000D31174F|nr:glycosyltransferase family 39 protein [Opitutus sp. ER46]PTX98630.1 hypothetical protein DB354_05040 [Opitutus sp. ER46]